MGEALVVRKDGEGVKRGQVTSTDSYALIIPATQNAQVSIVTNTASSSYSTGVTRLLIVGGKLLAGSYYNGGTSILELSATQISAITYNPTSGKITIPPNLSPQTYIMNSRLYEYIEW